MTKFITDLGEGSPIARYAVWDIDVPDGKQYGNSASALVIETSNNLLELATKHGIKPNSVIKLGA